MGSKLLRRPAKALGPLTSGRPSHLATWPAAGQATWPRDRGRPSHLAAAGQGTWPPCHLTLHLVHLAHLSQVDCQFVSGAKPFQNNNLQFDAGWFRPTWLTMRTVSGEENCG
jgi:hypothetical protein